MRAKSAISRLKRIIELHNRAEECGPRALISNVKAAGLSWTVRHATFAKRPSDHQRMYVRLAQKQCFQFGLLFVRLCGVPGNYYQLKANISNSHGIAVGRFSSANLANLANANSSSEIWLVQEWPLKRNEPKAYAFSRSKAEKCEPNICNREVRNWMAKEKLAFKWNLGENVDSRYFLHIFPGMRFFSRLPSRPICQQSRNNFSSVQANYHECIILINVEKMC